MLDRLKNVDMSHLKSCAMNYATDAKSFAKKAGARAVSEVKNMSGKKVMIAGRSVNPFLLGAAALALIGGTVYLLLKKRNKMQLAGMTGMEGQEYPVK
jgi:hypothetical protein